MVYSENASVDAVVDTILDEAKVGKVEEGKEVKADEVKADEVKADEAKVDEAKVDEAQADEAQVDEAKVDEAKVDEAKVDEAKVDKCNDVMMADGKSMEVDIVDIHKAVYIIDTCESGDVVMDEKKAIEALAKALDGPVMRLFEVADYEVHDGDLKTWFARGPFTSVKPDKMDEIALCFTRLAKIRRVQDAAVVEI